MPGCAGSHPQVMYLVIFSKKSVTLQVGMWLCRSLSKAEPDFDKLSPRGRVYIAKEHNLTLVLWGFVGYGQPLWLPHTGQAQGQPLPLVSTP